MDREALRRRCLNSFFDELGEYVPALNRNLLALEKEAAGEERTALLRELLRIAHSLKGAARVVHADVIERASHHLESILIGVRDGRRTPDAPLYRLLFAVVDGIEEAGQRLREQQDLKQPDLSAAPLTALLPRLEAAATGQPYQEKPPDAPPQVAAAPSPPPAVPPPAPPPPEAPPAPPEAPSGVGAVRVPAGKLDTFLARSGELLIARRRIQGRVDDVSSLREGVARWRAEWRGVDKPLAELLRQEDVAGDGPASSLPRPLAQVLGRVGDHLKELEKGLDRLASGMVGDGRFLKEAAGALDDEVRRVRLLPFAEACQGLDRVVRDLADAGGKDVALRIEGGDVEMDRSILEGLKDPLRHLVRNAVDHGADTPDQRRAAGKAPQTRLTVSAALRGDQVEVTVADDGRGLDLAALRQQLRRRGLPEPSDERELAQAVFLPGLSTARLITDVSGRGVGLDVVKSRVEAMHGTVTLTSEPGRGTRFTLALPLTLTTLRALLVSAGGQTFAFVAAAVQKLVRVEPTALRRVEGRRMLALGGPPLPAESLAELLGVCRGPWAAEREGPAARLPAVIVAAGDRRVAFLVDELLAEQEVVVKGLGSRIRRLRHVVAATVLPSGQIALVLNTGNLVRTALTRGPIPTVAAPSPRSAERGPRPAEPAVRKRVLVADDSVTTRTLECSILEAAGYEVLPAADGAAAWQLLQEKGADLLLSDVDMPRMDGFALTEAVRASKRFRELPVVLVTAREKDEDRARGVAVGADAYLGKSAFEQQQLLSILAQLIGVDQPAEPGAKP